MKRPLSYFISIAEILPVPAQILLEHLLYLLAGVVRFKRRITVGDCRRDFKFRRRFQFKWGKRRRRLATVQWSDGRASIHDAQCFLLSRGGQFTRN